jgi:hypothetical protein
MPRSTLAWLACGLLCAAAIVSAQQSDTQPTVVAQTTTATTVEPRSDAPSGERQIFLGAAPYQLVETMERDHSARQTPLLFMLTF